MKPTYILPVSSSFGICAVSSPTHVALDVEPRATSPFSNTSTYFSHLFPPEQKAFEIAPHMFQYGITAGVPHQNLRSTDANRDACCILLFILSVAVLFIHMWVDDGYLYAYLYRRSHGLGGRKWPASWEMERLRHVGIWKTVQAFRDGFLGDTQCTQSTTKMSECEELPPYSIDNLLGTSEYGLGHFHFQTSHHPLCRMRNSRLRRGCCP
jgi:hypothetical protein